MPGECFFDTNILVYAVSTDDWRCEVAPARLAHGGIISVQVLNDFVTVSRRKLRRPWPMIREDSEAFALLFPDPRPLTRETHRRALMTAEQDGLAFYDALIVAAALNAGCHTLLSEDLQDGGVFDGRLTVRNPFTA